MSTGTVDRIAYTTNSDKSILSAKKAYMDTAYGKYVPTLTYTTYTERGVEEKNYTGGCMTYTSPLGGLKIELSECAFDGGIGYRFNKDGTQSASCCDGEVANFSGSFAKSNALYVFLTGNIAEHFDVQYKVCIGGRWTGWKSNGAICGRTSSGSGRYYIERVAIRLVQKKDPSFGTVKYVAEYSDPVNEPVIAGNVIRPGGYVPKKIGFAFAGWYTDEDRTVPYDNTSVAAKGKTLTLFAGFERTSFMSGDLNADEKITSRDLALLKRCVANASAGEYVEENADVDGDGKTTSKDIAKMKRMLAGQIAE